jgi:hypothetical protein
MRIETNDIDPPVFRDKPGRKQIKRRKGQFEAPAPRDTSRMANITCSNYKQVGHRFSSCMQPLKTALQIRKTNHMVRFTLYLHCPEPCNICILATDVTFL